MVIVKSHHNIFIMKSVDQYWWSETKREVTLIDQAPPVQKIITGGRFHGMIRNIGDTMWRLMGINYTVYDIILI